MLASLSSSAAVRRSSLRVAQRALSTTAAAAVGVARAATMVAGSRRVLAASSSSSSSSSRLVSAHVRSSLVQSRAFSSKYPDHIVLTMPALSPTMEKGNIATWKKQVGDHVKVGEEMAQVETDKATVAFESVEEGYIAKILVGDGAADVTVGTPVAVLAESKDDVAAFADFAVGGASSSPAAAAAAAPAAAAAVAPAAAPAAAASSSSSSGDRVVASPAAKRVAGELGVSLNGITGTGPDGRIVQADVLEAKASAPAVAAVAAAAAPAPAAAAAAAAPRTPSAGDFIDIPHTNIRKVIASRLLQSKQTIPHYYLTAHVQVDKVLKLRAELNKQLADSGVKISVNDLIVKAAALACRKVPTVNSSWLDNAVRQYNYVDVSVAVSTDAGLVTPIIADADIKGLATIAADTKALAGKARANKLQPHEYQGGTFTISNLGMFGVNNFSAIINPPQGAILAVGTTETKVVPGADAGSFTTAQVLSVTLSCDHRVIDGAVGAQWLQAFRNYLENPVTMLL